MISLGLKTPSSFDVILLRKRVYKNITDITLTNESNDVNRRNFKLFTRYPSDCFDMHDPSRPAQFTRTAISLHSYPFRVEFST